MKQTHTYFISDIHLGLPNKTKSLKETFLRKKQNILLPFFELIQASKLVF